VDSCRATAANPPKVDSTSPQLFDQGNASLLLLSPLQKCQVSNIMMKIANKQPPLSCPLLHASKKIRNYSVAHLSFILKMNEGAELLSSFWIC